MKKLFLSLALLLSINVSGNEILDAHLEMIKKDLKERRSCVDDNIRVQCLNGDGSAGGVYFFSAICFDIGVEACDRRFNYMGLGPAFFLNSETVDHQSVRLGEHLAVSIQSYYDAEAERKAALESKNSLNSSQ